jgi:hypothetical protein
LASFWGLVTISFLRGEVVSLTPNPQPGGLGYPFLSGSSPLTCLAWESLPVAYATASIALGIIWPHKPRHYVKVRIPSGVGDLLSINICNFRALRFSCPPPPSPPISFPKIRFFAIHHWLFTLFITRTLHLVTLAVPRAFRLILKTMYNVLVTITQNFPLQTYHPFCVTLYNYSLILKAGAYPGFMGLEACTIFRTPPLFLKKITHLQIQNYVRKWIFI